MRTLTLTLLAEGNTDDRFLPSIIQRTAQSILISRNATDIDIWAPIPISRNKVDGENLETRILNAARMANGMHILFIHQDADSREIGTCYAERIEPGLRLVQMEDDGVCKHIVPVIPVRNIEAWLLCDPDTLIRVVGTPMTPEELGIAMPPQSVERIIDPKQRFQEVVRSALSRRRGSKPDTGIYFERLGREINLDLLSRVPAYISFRNRLHTCLQELNFFR